MGLFHINTIWYQQHGEFSTIIIIDDAKTTGNNVALKIRVTSSTCYNTGTEKPSVEDTGEGGDGSG